MPVPSDGEYEEETKIILSSAEVERTAKL